MKKVLVVSDNVELVGHIQQIAESLSFIAEFDYAYSVINKSPNALAALSMSAADMKDKSYIDEVVEKYDLVISAHCKQIFPKEIVDKVRCINIHPGMNPYNRGWYPQVFSIINKLPIGCTIHLMDEEIDHGAILYQQEVKIEVDDTSLDVYQKVIAAEKKLIEIHLVDIVNGDYKTRIPTDDGNYNGISDFNALCELELEHIGTLSEHIDLLRALTHGSFDNAYFFYNGEKYTVKLKIKKVVK